MMHMDKLPGAAESAAVAGAVLVSVWFLRRGRPASYPGDPVPESSRLRADAKLKPVASRVVHGGWRPRAEEQPKNGLLPHQVSGQQVWEFSDSAEPDVEPFHPEANPNSADCLLRHAKLTAWKGSKPDSAKPGDANHALRKGFQFYTMLQCEDGHWAGDYGGPHFLLPGFVIAAYISGHLKTIFPEPHRQAIQAYLLNHQQQDGGWGSHIESPSTMFGTVLNYVALRLVGVDAEDPACQQGRDFLQQHGGALYAPSWAKFWLACLGVYDWDGIAPVPPEMWMLPSWFPLHPGRRGPA